jgi:hypothetical protein
VGWPRGSEREEREGVEEGERRREGDEDDPCVSEVRADVGMERIGWVGVDGRRGFCACLLLEWPLFIRARRSAATSILVVAAATDGWMVGTR